MQLFQNMRCLFDDIVFVGVVRIPEQVFIYAVIRERLYLCLNFLSSVCNIIYSVCSKVACRKILNPWSKYCRFQDIAVSRYTVLYCKIYCSVRFEVGRRYSKISRAVMAWINHRAHIVYDIGECLPVVTDADIVQRGCGPAKNIGCQVRLFCIDALVSIFQEALNRIGLGVISEIFIEKFLR